MKKSKAINDLYKIDSISIVYLLIFQNIQSKKILILFINLFYLNSLEIK